MADRHRLPINEALTSAVGEVLRTAEGLRDDPACALGECCPAAASCWGDRADPHRSHGSVFVPWIGPDYRPGGVCVVGLNLRIGTGNGTYWGIEQKIASDQYAALSAGVSRSKGSRWSSATMRDAALTLRSIAGQDLAA